MITVHSSHRVREAEEAWFAAHPDQRDELMQRASTAVAELAQRLLAGRTEHSGRPARVLVLAGGGNNGGDALFAAAQLAAAGCEIVLWATSGEAHPQGLAALRAAGCREVDAVQACAELPEVDLLLDGVLGIGGRPGLPDEVATLAAEAEGLGVETLAVDLPSGLDADAAELPSSSVRATHTITFISRKPCHVMQPARSRCGQVHLVDIGVDPGTPTLRQLEVGDVAARWPLPGPTSDKYSRGVVGIETGSPRYPGAAVLGTTGALFAGAGMIRFVGAERAGETIHQLMPSVTHGEGKVQAWLVGSGWGSTEANRDRLSARLVDHRPMVIDADALGVLPAELPDNCLLTPHAGELARMLGVPREQVEAAPLEHARQAAERWRATVLLKGATQYVVCPDGSVLLAVPGPHWSAQAGSGDVLAGICATLLASGLEARWAAALGASAQAMAAGRRPGPHPPEEVARAVAEVVGEFPEH